MRVALAAIAALTLTWCSAQAARADHIDNELLKESPQLVKALHDKGYKNVGVLKFMVKIGTHPQNANVGPMNLVMATRIENALIHASGDTHPLGVVRNATAAAAKADPKFSTQSAEGRTALFKHKYPLAWGHEQVVPDAFVTGTVELSHDLRQTTVTINGFDKSGAAPHKLLSFTVPTDRSILADSGRSFVVTSRSLHGSKRSARDLDQVATTSATTADNGQGVTQQATGDMPIKFDIQFNATSQVINQDPGNTGQMRMVPPQTDDTVTFVVTNTSQNKIGVVIKVNGESTLNQDTSEDAACLKWILTAGQSYTIRGFYSKDDNQMAPFKVLNDEDSAARMAEWSGSHPRAGYIDVAVFSESSSTGTDTNADLTVGRMLRGIPRSMTSHKGRHWPSTQAEAQSLLQNHGKTRGAHGHNTRGLIVAGDDKIAANLKEDQLNNPTFTFQLQVNFYTPATP